MTKEASVDYDKAGHKLAIEIEIKESELPQRLTYISTTYPYKKIKETAKITDDIKVITYEAEIKIDGKDCDLILMLLGNF
jgi:hypothetical protein